MTEHPIMVSTHKEASSNQPPHEPDLEGDLVVVQALPIGEEQQQVGDHADEGRGQQDQAHQAGALPRTAHSFSCFVSAASLSSPRGSRGEEIKREVSESEIGGECERRPVLTQRKSNVSDDSWSRRDGGNKGQRLVWL